MQVILDEKELKKTLEYYLQKTYGLTVQSENIKFTNKQDKPISLNGAVVTINESVSNLKI